MTFPSHVFRAYDIRGVVGEAITPEFTRELGRAIGTIARRQKRRALSVGRDCRTHGPELAAALIEGLRSTGIEVVDLGMVPTPLVYFSLFHLEPELEGGIMVTGSHNPKEFNGFKICLGQTSTHGEGIQEIRRVMEQQDYETGKGRYRERPIVRDYIDYLKANLSFARTDLKVVIDAGNAAAGPVIEPLLRELGFDVTALYCEPDGNFPNHHPDPTEPENLEALIDAVAKKNADIGIAYDGDGDRIGVVDDQGSILWGDRLMILLSRRLLEEEPGAAIVGEVKCSQTLFDDIAAHGGRPILSKVGHSLIKALMAEEGALLAGEMSGHIFFKHRYFGYDDAIYATGRVLEVLAATDVPLSELMDDVPVTHVTPEIRMPCPDAIKFGVVERAVATFKRDREVIDIDGARVLFEHGWGLVRASNTQPVLVLRCESTSAEGLAEIREHIEAVVQGAIAAASAPAEEPAEPVVEAEQTIDAAETRRIAALARLELSDDEVGRFTGQLNSILHYVATIEELDLGQADPAEAPRAAPLREDEVVEGLRTKDALAPAPQSDGTSFVVPRVVG